MKIAVDKNSVSIVKNDNNKYIYVFNNETLEELINTNLTCIYYENIRYVDINLTNYDIDCIKKAKVTDKDYNILPEKKDYKFAIIVPNCNNDHGNYNGKTFFRNCIDSILNQTYKNFELIIVDDLSTDTSINTAKEYQKKDKRIHFIQNKRKRYNGGSRNVGIEYALDNIDFDYFCFLDSDDWWKHNEVLELINNRLYNCELMTIGCEGIGIAYKHFNKARCYEDLYSLNGNVWCTAWSKVIRKDKIVYFCENTLMEDRVWTYRQADNIDFKNVVNLNEICYCWNRTNTTNSVSLVRSQFWDACSYCHIGHQLQLLTELKHKEMIPKIKKRIDECIKNVNKGIYEQH